MKCLHCSQPIVTLPSLRELFLFRPDTGARLCAACLDRFGKIDTRQACQGCCKPNQSILCEDCQAWRARYPQYDFKHTALFNYDLEMREWFRSYKFQGNYALRFSFAQNIARALKNKKKWLIIPIPLSADRLAERGFNQVEALLAAAEVPYADCLQRSEGGKPQAQKDRAQRLATIQPFSLKKECASQVVARDVLLVDDIYTTGRTLFHASQLLLKYPVKKIETFSLAR